MREKVQAVNSSMPYENTLNFGRVYTLPLFSCFTLGKFKGKMYAAVSATAVCVESLLLCWSGAEEA